MQVEVDQQLSNKAHNLGEEAEDYSVGIGISRPRSNPADIAPKGNQHANAVGDVQVEVDQQLSNKDSQPWGRGRRLLRWYRDQPTSLKLDRHCTEGEPTCECRRRPVSTSKDPHPVRDQPIPTT